MGSTPVPTHDTVLLQTVEIFAAGPYQTIAALSVYNIDPRTYVFLRVRRSARHVSANQS